MASFCRTVGAFVLVLATVGLLVERLDWATAAAAVALVWYVASFVAEFISTRQRRHGP